MPIVAYLTSSARDRACPKLGHSRHFERATLTSGLPLRTDINAPTRLVRFVPDPEVIEARPRRSCRSRFERVPALEGIKTSLQSNTHALYIVYRLNERPDLEGIATAARPNHHCQILAFVASGVSAVCPVWGGRKMLVHVLW
jgi:hypothetical protein